MLNFFKSNNPGVVIAYLFYLVLFRLCFGMLSYSGGGFGFSNHEPFSQVVFGFMNHQFSSNELRRYQIISLVLSGILTFIQALIVNRIVNENKIVSRNNYLPGVFFIIFASFFRQSLLLSPASIALTFLLLCAGKIFSLSKKEKAYGDVYDTGFLIALATLFYFPSILFIVFAYIGLGTVRAFTYREWVITLIGFLSPFFLVFTYYYWNDNTAMLLGDIINFQYPDPPHWLVGINKLSSNDYMMLGFLLLCILGALAFLPAALYSSLIQVRKFSTTLVFFILLVVISFSLQHIVNLSHFIWMALPLSIIFTMVIFQVKRKRITEIIHLILILLVLVGQYLPIIQKYY